MFLVFGFGHLGILETVFSPRDSKTESAVKFCIFGKRRVRGDEQKNKIGTKTTQ